MKILDRYIAGVVMAGTGIALILILGFDLFFSIINQLDEVGKGTYTQGKMLLYVLLTMPRSLYELFPTVALVGSLMGMGFLAANGELTAMRAAGMSVWRIVRSVVQAGVVMLFFVVMLGEYVAPVAEQYGQGLRASAISKGISVTGSHGLWIRDEERFIHVRRIVNEHTLADLTILEFDKDLRMRSATHAASATFQQNHWLLRQVNRSRFAETSVTAEHLDTEKLESVLTPELISVIMLKPQNMSVRSIRQYVDYLDENGLDSRPYQYAFWSRIVTPASAIIMLIISVPFVFSGLRSVSVGQRVFVGILTGIGFYLLNQIAGQMGQVYNLNPLLASATPGLVFLVLGVLAIRRV